MQHTFHSCVCVCVYSRYEISTRKYSSNLYAYFYCLTPVIFLSVCWLLRLNPRFFVVFAPFRFSINNAINFRFAFSRAKWLSDITFYFSWFAIVARGVGNHQIHQKDAIFGCISNEFIQINSKFIRFYMWKTSFLFPIVGETIFSSFALSAVGVCFRCAQLKLIRPLSWHFTNLLNRKKSICWF